MKVKFFISVIIVGLFVGYVAVLAFSEPAASPPGGNVPAPLNIGPQAQSKEGNLELENVKARDGIELGGVVRKTWPVEREASCSWQGTRCTCSSDSASVGSVRVVLGMTCNQGQVTNIKIMSLDISSKSKNCRSAAPAGCTPGLYTRD